MSEKKVASVECDIPGGLSEYIDINSDASLLDWDIILFHPNIYSLVGRNETYKGKPALSHNNSYHLREYMKHWRRELIDALQVGKTIIVFVAELYEVYIDTGENEYGVIGRKYKTTNEVELFNNYKCLPFDIKMTKSKGSAMRLAKGGEILASYWSKFSEYSSYKVLIEGQNIKPLVTTETGEKTVGALVSLEDFSGTLLLLPYLNIDSDEFEEEDEDGDFIWTKKGKQFGRQLLGAIIEIDRALKESKAVTPTPEWAKVSEYDLPKEAKLREESLKIDERIMKLQQEKQLIKEKLVNEGLLKRLLFEKGKPLEEAILLTLKLMDFTADNYSDGESEFDAVFESPEGRFLGEAEGKDNKAIGIDKLRQLEMNIQEDFAREEVDEYATGVLFSNAFRLLPVNDRNAFFTEKCLKSAKRSGTILVQTPDLFRVAQYLSDKTNNIYAKECRKSMLESKGEIVMFPEPPLETTSRVKIKENTKNSIK